MPKILTPREVLEFRQRLCDLALKAFAEQGVDGVSLRNLASAAGCSRTTPYRYFKNKADILAAVRESEFRKMADRMERAAADEKDPLQRLRKLARCYLDFALSRPDAYRVMHSIQQKDEQQYPELVREITRSQKPMVSTVKEAIKAGSIEGDALDVAHVLWAGLHGLISLHLADKLHMGRTVDDLGDVMINALGRAVAASPAP